MKPQSKYSLSLGIAILTAGMAGMFILFQFREPPAEASTDPEARGMDVEVRAAEPVDHTIVVEGYGTARSAVSVSISPEVSGRVVYANPALRVGGRVAEGELLVRIDPERYAADVAEAEARIGQIEAEIQRLKTAQADAQSRFGALQRTRELARTQFERAQTLLAEHVGTQLEVDRSEQAYNDASDRARQLQSTLNTYPLEIEEAEKRLEAARAALDRARLNLERTEIHAPFAGRIDHILATTMGEISEPASPSLAPGHYAEAGRPLLVLADDTWMEVPIKLDMRDAHDWLRWSDEGGQRRVAPVECTVTWTEIQDGPSWTGILDRIENYDGSSRTMTAVVAVDLAQQPPESFPLADGMFCAVRLPGSTLTDVFIVPQSGISVDGTVHVARDGRLESRPVHVARTEGSVAYVDDGLFPGDLVVTTRLVNPIDGTLLRIASSAVPAE